MRCSLRALRQTEETWQGKLWLGKRLRETLQHAAWCSEIGSLWSSGGSRQRRKRRALPPQKEREREREREKKYVEIVLNELKRDPYEDADVEVDGRF